MRIGLLLLGPFPERLVYAASSLAQSIRAADGMSGAEIIAFSTDGRLAGQELPGFSEPLRVVFSQLTEYHGDYCTGSAFQSTDYLKLEGGGSEECDFWILVDESTGFPLSMSRPTFLWVPEFTDRYITGSFPNSAAGWAFVRRAAFKNRLAAQHVIVHDEKASKDASYFAQIPADRVSTLPWPLLNSLSTDPDDRPRASPYFFWHLSMENIGNIDPMIAAIDSYMDRYFGQCAIVVGGAILAHSATSPKRAQNEAVFAAQVREKISARPWPKDMVQFVSTDSAESLIQWGAHAAGIIMGRGWRANQPLYDLARIKQVPTILLGGTSTAAFTKLALPDAHILNAEHPDATSAMLKQCEVRIKTAPEPVAPLPSKGSVTWGSLFE